MWAVFCKKRLLLRVAYQGKGQSYASSNIP